MKKKKIHLILDIILIIAILFDVYLLRHKIARGLNDYFEKPITELNLTMEQKLSDFEYFYDCIVSSVPADTLQEFENRYGISFADKYDVYRDMVKDTKTDLEFFTVMDIIGEELPSFHTGMAYPDYGYYKSLGCWNIEDVLDTRYIKSKAQYWNNTLKENAQEFWNQKIQEFGFWYKNGEYISGDGTVLLAVDGVSVDEIYDNYSVSKILYDDIYCRTYRASVRFYSIPYSKNLSEQVTIQCKTSEGTIKEYSVYRDEVANLLTGCSQVLGVQPKEQLYVKDDLCYSYVDKENDILYLHFWEIGRESLSGVGNIINSAACDNIIIDIRDNSGGYFNSINHYLYPFLYEDDIQVDYTWYMPKTDYTKKMTSEWEACIELAFRKSDFTAIGADGEKQIYKESTKEVRLTGGKNAKDYNVYLLISNTTGSAADTLANVLKANNAATLVGSNTGGEGLMNSFLVDYLPESGIVFTYMPALSFNEEGKNNGVYGTAPHYYAHDYVEGVYPNKAEYNARGEDPYTYVNRLEWDAVLNKAIDLIGKG